MPLYEYECEACGHRFEAIQKFSDPPLTACRKCGGPVHKLIASPAFQFKGTGWYITDYAKKDNGGAGKSSASENDSAAAKNDKSEKSDTPKSESSSPASGESPASKPPAKD